MPFKYSCFISYRASQTELTVTFIDELKKALDSYVAPYVDRKVFIDYERITGGDVYTKSLATALCESLCMILVFTPNYFNKEKTFCTREYLTMKLLEKRRLAAIREKCSDSLGLIIPIVFRGFHHLPSEIKNQRHCYDFSKYSLVDAKIAKNKEYTEHVMEIAERIARLSKCFNDINQEELFNCKNLDLPTEEQARTWLRTLDTPSFEYPGP